ncbi:hypothetical protein [Archangium sp.]|uniref:hypothetical protein n=1 Tax=Archangium sp. TaxID=1872627 RepID=UPI00389A2989
MNQTNGSNTFSELTTLEQVRDRMIAYLREGNAGHYNIGRLYNHAVTTLLAGKNGAKSAQEYFSQHLQELSQATLTRYGAVAREFSEEACRQYGVVKLTTLLTYANAAKLQLQPAELGSTPIDVPEKEGAVARKPFAECSLEDLRKAVKYKKEPSAASVPDSDNVHLEFLRKCVAKHFAKGAQVQLKTSVQKGKTLLTIQGVPLNDLERLVEMLMDGLQPQPQLVRSVG